MDKVMHWIESTEIPARYDNDKFLYRQAKAMGFPGMVVECSHPKQTWRGYLVERFLPVADDNTAKTWQRKDPTEVSRNSPSPSAPKSSSQG